MTPRGGARKNAGRKYLTPEQIENNKNNPNTWRFSFRFPPAFIENLDYRCAQIGIKRTRALWEAINLWMETTKNGSERNPYESKLSKLPKK